MPQLKETFESLLMDFEPRYDSRTVFNDFLTLTLCAFSPNPLTGLSHDEDLYMETIDKYKSDNLRFNFPKMLSALTLEMEEKTHSKECTDVLGNFYEKHLYRKGAQQFFTPWPICQFMAKSCLEATEKKEERLRILEPSCGSGRMLLAASEVFGKDQEYYAVDLDPVCVKMTAINLFLNGMFHSEVLSANFLLPEDFIVSYRISFLPFGIFRIKEKEQSKLWYLLKNTLTKQEKEVRTPPPFEPSVKQEGEVVQLKIF